jgi:purine-nucleoside phosphorylase
MTVHAEALERAVAAARAGLEQLGAARPAMLGLCATGVGFLPERLVDARAFPLAEVEGVPEPWRRAELVVGRLGAVDGWWLDDLSAEPEAVATAPWVRGFPCWLAAAAGARVLVHTSAGSALPAAEGRARIEPGTLALVRDHVNLSGRSPLTGLGASRLGPLFPDPSRLYDSDLRRAALRAAERLGLSAVEAIAACTIGPSLDTPAERAYFARAGADVAVQGLDGALLAALHAGLVALAVVAVTDAGEGGHDLGRLLERSSRIAPALEDLVLALAPDLARAVDAAVAGSGA